MDPLIMGIGPSIKAPDELTRPHTKKERAHLLDPGLPLESEQLN